MTQVGVYDEILPEPSGNPSGSALGITLGLRQYFIVYPSSRHNTVTISDGNEILDPLLKMIADRMLIEVQLASGGEELRDCWPQEEERSCRTAGLRRVRGAAGLLASGGREELQDCSGQEEANEQFKQYIK